MTFYLTNPDFHVFQWMGQTLNKWGSPRTVEELNILIELDPGIGDSDDILEEVADGLAYIGADSVLAGACLGHECSMLEQVEIVLLTDSGGVLRTLNGLCPCGYLLSTKLAYS